MATRRKLNPPQTPDSPDSPLDVPAVPAVPAVPVDPGSGLANTLNLSGMPSFNALAPSDLFNPSSSPVPRTSADQLQSGLEVAREQGNSIKLLHANLDNAIELAKAAVKQTKLVKIGVQYQIGLEEIQTENQNLITAQVVTQNASKKTQLAVEQGKTIDQQVIGQGIKTDVQGQKNSVDRLEIDYLTQAKPLVEQKWKAKLEGLKQQITEATAERAK